MRKARPPSGDTSDATCVEAPVAAAVVAKTCPAPGGWGARTPAARGPDTAGGPEVWMIMRIVHAYTSHDTAIAVSEGTARQRHRGAPTGLPLD